MAIVSFGDRDTERFYVTGKIGIKAPWRNLGPVVRRKLDMLHYAHQLMDLRSPPGNRLEMLRGNRTGMHSIRINDQWRIVFRWTESGPVDVEICDYHK